MSLGLPNTAVRHSLIRTVFRQRYPLANAPRFSSSKPSTSAEATQKKAQDALANAQRSASNIWNSTKKLLEPAGQKFGQMLGSYKQPLLYNLSVTREVLKQIYIAESLQLPSITTIRSAYETLWSRGSSLTYWRGITQSSEIARVGIYGVEAYGIFKIGEILGRRNLVGYDLH